MAFCDLYAKGYNAGFRKGVDSALHGSVARSVMEKDLIYIYGTMCLALKDRGWKSETIESLVIAIQKKWTSDLGEYEETETMRELVLRETGIDLVQMSGEVLEAGKADYLEV